MMAGEACGWLTTEDDDGGGGGGGRECEEVLRGGSIKGFCVG